MFESLLISVFIVLVIGTIIQVVKFKSTKGISAQLSNEMKKGLSSNQASTKYYLFHNKEKVKYTNRLNWTTYGTEQIMQPKFYKYNIIINKGDWISFYSNLHKKTLEGFFAGVDNRNKSNFCVILKADADAMQYHVTKIPNIEIDIDSIKLIIADSKSRITIKDKDKRKTNKKLSEYINYWLNIYCRKAYDTDEYNKTYIQRKYHLLNNADKELYSIFVFPDRHWIETSLRNTIISRGDRISFIDNNEERISGLFIGSDQHSFFHIWSDDMIKVIPIGNVKLATFKVNERNTKLEKMHGYYV